MRPAEIRAIRPAYKDSVDPIKWVVEYIFTDTGLIQLMHVFAADELRAFQIGCNILRRRGYDI